MNETTGKLKPVIETYLLRPSEMTLRDVAIMRTYLVQWIGSPAWEAMPHGTEDFAEGLAALRLEAGAIRTVREIDAAIAHMTEAGLDPL
jgi:hypothetical protein